MPRPTVEEVRQTIVAVITRSLPSGASSVSDSYNMLTEGVVDSFGFIELLAELEQRFGITIDLDGLEPERLGEVGALSRHIAEVARRA